MGKADRPTMFEIQVAPTHVGKQKEKEGASGKNIQMKLTIL